MVRRAKKTDKSSTRGSLPIKSKVLAEQQHDAKETFKQAVPAKKAQARPTGNTVEDYYDSHYASIFEEVRHDIT